MRNYLLLFGLFFISSFSYATIHYVKQDSAGTGDGSSWQNAAWNLGSVVYNASSGDTVWVAHGVYYPTLDGSGNASAASNAHISLTANNIVLLGGFSGTETDLSQRNPKTHQTIITGDPQQYGLNTGSNNYSHLMILADPVNVVISGFVFEKATSLAILSMGSSGMGLSITDCIFRNNISGISASSLRVDRVKSVLIQRCEFTDNIATEAPAIWITNNAVVTVAHCKFKNNTATSHGGAVTVASIVGGGALFSNCLFENNKALGTTYAGGALHNYQTGINNPTLVYNCTFVNNRTSVPANQGHSINLNSAHVEVKNSIFWNHEPFNGSHFRLDGTASTTNISNSIAQNSENLTSHVYDVYPEFNDTVNGNFTLLPHSPAVDSGDTSGIGIYVGTVDLNGNNRIEGSSIDYGAYEFFCPQINNNIFTSNNNLTLHVPSTQAALYKWYDCTTGVSISGANDSVFTPSFSGTFACIIETLCESDTTTCLEVCIPLDLSVSRNGSTLKASQSGVDYRWINCEDFSIIPGENQSQYTPEASGDYACVLDDGFCKDTTDCFNVVISGISNINRQKIRIYPNPVIDVLGIDYGGEILSLRISDLNGRTVMEFNGRNKQINLENLPSGIYVVTIVEKNKTHMFKTIKQ